MRQVTFKQLEVGKRYRVVYPWIPNYYNEGVITAIRPLTHAKDEIHYDGEPYTQFVLLTDREAKKRNRKGYKSPFAADAVAQMGDSFFYDTPIHDGRFNLLFEL